MDSLPDPAHEISDAEFEQMVSDAERMTAHVHYHHGINRKRWEKIRAFKADLRDMTIDELTSHFEWVQLTAKPYPHESNDSRN